MKEAALHLEIENNITYNFILLSSTAEQPPSVSFVSYLLWLGGHRSAQKDYQTNQIKWPFTSTRSS